MFKMSDFQGKFVLSVKLVQLHKLDYLTLSISNLDRRGGLVDALHAGDQSSIPGRNRHSIKLVVTVPLPNARQQV